MVFSSVQGAATLRDSHIAEAGFRQGVGTAPCAAEHGMAAPGLLSGGSGRDRDWSLEKCPSQAQQKEEIFTAKASPDPTSQLHWCRTLPSGEVSKEQ